MMTNKEKRQQLIKLREKIKSKKTKSEVVWFFEDYFKDHPENREVGGFLGTGLFFFIFPNPSKKKIENGIEPSNHQLENFFKILRSLNIKNAHLTDFIKTRLSAKKAQEYWSDEKLFCKHLSYLEKEIEILRKNSKIKVIIVGRSYYAKIKPKVEKLVENEPKCIHHYACRVPDKWGIIKKELEEIAEGRK